MADGESVEHMINVAEMGDVKHPPAPPEYRGESGVMLLSQASDAPASDSQAGDTQAGDTPVSL